MQDANQRLKDFIGNCRMLARSCGKTDRQAALMAACCWGLEPNGALTYSDNIVEITVEAAPSLRVLVIRQANKNPVLCTNKSGMPYRWHGEANHIVPYVESLLKEEATT